MRQELVDAKEKYDKTEEDLKAVQNVGQLVGDVLKQLDDERCKPPPFLFVILCKR